MNCPHKRLMAGRERDEYFCLDCFETVDLAKALPEPGKSKQTNPRTRESIPPAERVR